MNPIKKVSHEDKKLEKVLNDLFGDLYNRVGGVESTVNDHKSRLSNLSATIGNILNPEITPGPIVGPGIILSCTVSASFTDVLLLWTISSITDVNGKQVVDRVEIWASSTNNQTTSTLVGTEKLPSEGFFYYIGTTGTTKYVWLRCIMTDGTPGPWYPTTPLSGIVCTTTSIPVTGVDDFSITASKMFLNIPIVEGDPWSNNSPAAGSIGWAQHNLYFNGVKYIIPAGHTAIGEKYVYWTGLHAYYSTSVGNPADSSLLDPKNGFIIAVNNSGTVVLAWRSIANEVIGTAFIMNGAITNAKIHDLSADKITTGTLTSVRLNSASGYPRLQILPVENSAIIMRAQANGSLDTLVCYGSSSGDYNAGDVLIGDYANSKGVRWDQTNGKLIIKGALSSVLGDSIIPARYYSDLKAQSYGSNTVLSITAAHLSLVDVAGKRVTIKQINVSNNITTTGAGGRDQAGAFNQYDWVHFYVLYNEATGNVSSISSLSPIQPTLTGVSYTHWIRVCARWCDLNNQFYPCMTRDDTTWWGANNTLVLTDGDCVAAGSWYSISLSNAIPTTAKSVFGNFGGGSSAGTRGMAVAATSNGECKITQTIGFTAAASTNYEPTSACWFDIPVLEPQVMYYTGSITNLNMDVVVCGWVDAI